MSDRVSTLLSLLGPSDGATVLLAGELRRPGALADALSAIVRAGWSGELIVMSGTTSRSIYIGSPSIVGAATNALSERIGAVMTRMGALDPDQLGVVVSKLGAAKRFGEVAIDEGFLTRERLFEVLRHQAEFILYGAISVGDGAFVFLDGFDATRIPARCHLDAREATNNALARLSAGAAVEAASLEEPIAKFNHAIKTIFRAVAMEGRAGALRAALDAYAAESPIDRAVFAVGRIAPDGRIETAGVAETLASLGVRDARATITKRLHEYLVYALFVASAELPKDEERAMLAEVEASMGALTPRPPPVRSIPPASSLRPNMHMQAHVHAQAHGDASVNVNAMPSPRPASPVAVTTPVARRRSSLAPLVVLLMAVAFGVAFAAARWPLWSSTQPAPAATPFASPTVVASPSPSPSLSPTPSPSPSPVASSSLTTPSSVGTIRAADSGGHRVWIDGKLVGDTPQNYEVVCGNHVVRIGSAGQPQMIEVPCGGDVQVELR